jgi:hydroxymethylpyrimidine pyrophosphatase-like HAD family hydrolase
MFEWAGWRRVAVANAHDEILALADEVTASNDADGVAAWLESLLSEEGGPAGGGWPAAGTG